MSRSLPARARTLSRIAVLVLAPLVLAAWSQSSWALQISEFRLRGPAGANDEFIRIHNETSTALTVAASSGTGYGIAASDGVTRCTIPNGTVIPAGGSYLCANSGAYSLAGNSSGVADATYTTDIPDNAGIALFNNNSGGGDYILANRIDAVGSTSEANTLYKEGSGYPALTPFSIDYAWTRDRCGKGGSITTAGTCTALGVPIDTDNNAADFVFVDTNGTSAGGGQRLGAPGPSNLAGPVMGSAVTHDVFDSCSAVTAPPNTIRDLTSDPANNSTFGTLDIRRTFTNTSGQPITRLRLRVIDLTTFPAPSGFADLRPRTSSDVSVLVDRTPCGSDTNNVTVFGTTLEQPPAQPNGGGFNTTMTVPSVTPGTPLAPGASIDLRFLLGIQQDGAARFSVAIEALPEGGAIFEYAGCTNGTCAPPQVSSIVAAETSPTNAGVVTFTVTFDQAVTGVDAADFVVPMTGGVSGAAVTSVTGSGTTYTVTVNTGTGSGTVGLNLVDDDSIVNGTSASLGGVGPGNGNFTGQTYALDKTAPTVTVEQAGAQADPVAVGPVNFTVTFSEDVTGFTAANVVLSGTAGATTAVVTGGPSVYNVAVSGMTGPGSVIMTVTSGPTDAVGNPSAASTSVDNIVTFNGSGSGGNGDGGGDTGGPVAAIPTLSEWGLLMLTSLIGLAAWRTRRRMTSEM